METDRAFVAYIDILGYADFIKIYKPKEYADVINRSLNITDGAGNSPEIIFTTLIKYVSVNVLSDSIIVALDMNIVSKMKEVFKKARALTIGNEDRLIKSIVTKIFFTILSNITIEFISHTGFLLRGAIEYGDYTVMNIRDNKDKLIHSNALVRACELEKIADLPRIVLAKDAVTQLQLLSKSGEQQSYILRDFDGVNILNIYRSLGASDPKRARRVLKNVVTNILSRTPAKDDLKKRRKYDWFQNFHNQRILSLTNLKPLISKKYLFTI